MISVNISCDKPVPIVPQSCPRLCPKSFQDFRFWHQQNQSSLSLANPFHLLCVSHWATPEMLDELISWGLDPSRPDSQGQTALMVASRHRHDLLPHLLKWGCPIDATDENGFTVLHHASSGRENEKAVQMILNAQNLMSPITKDGDPAAKTTWVNSRTHTGRSALFFALGCVDQTVLLLLRAGSSPNIETTNGFALSEIAINFVRSQKVMGDLLDFGMDHRLNSDGGHKFLLSIQGYLSRPDPPPQVVEWVLRQKIIEDRKALIDHLGDVSCDLTEDLPRKM